MRKMADARVALVRSIGSAFDELPTAKELAEENNIRLVNARNFIEQVDPIDQCVRPADEEMVDECIKRIKASGDGGEADLDKSQSESARIVPIKGHRFGGDGPPEWLLPNGSQWIADETDKAGESSCGQRKRMLFLHGGGYEYYTPSDVYRPLTTRLAAVTGMPILAIDYRKCGADGAPFPAALEDALNALAWLWKHGPPLNNKKSTWRKAAADAVYISGDSAGGGLALAVIAALGMDELAPHIPLPPSCIPLRKAMVNGQRPPVTALALMSPWIDLTCSFPSYTTRQWNASTQKGDFVFSDGDPQSEITANITNVKRAKEGYASGAVTDLYDPRISPVYMPSEVLRKYLPPTLIVVGDAEVMLSESLEFTARAIEASASTTDSIKPAPVKLRVYRRMWHVFPMYTEACGQAPGAAWYGWDTQTTRAYKAGRADAIGPEYGLPHAWLALHDINDWLKAHPPPPSHSPISRRFVTSRIGPALMCVLTVVVAELILLLLPSNTPAPPPPSPAPLNPWWSFTPPPSSPPPSPSHLNEPTNLLFLLLGALFIILNSLIRLIYPSSYCPRTQITHSILGSPLTARTLATFAELAFYYIEAQTLQLPFWNSPLGDLTTLGEVLCWAHVLLQAELLGCIEDTIWTIYQIYAFLNSHVMLKYIVCLPYVLNATIGGHLKRQYSRVDRTALLGTAPYWRTPKRVGHSPDEGQRSWAAPSLLAKPVTYALLRLAGSPALSDRLLWFGVLPALVVILLKALRWEEALYKRSLFSC